MFYFKMCIVLLTILMDITTSNGNDMYQFLDPHHHLRHISKRKILLLAKKNPTSQNS